MHYEYAIDPAAVQDERDLQAVMNTFGWEHGRLILDLPPEWEKGLLALAAERKSPRLAKLAEEFRKRRPGRVISRTRLAAGDGAHWLAWALAEHERMKLRAILVPATEPEQAPCLPMPPDISHELLAMPAAVMPRQPRQFGQALRLILQTGREVWVVDPWFDPEQKRFRDTLKAMVDLMQQTTAYRRPEGQTLALHTVAKPPGEEPFPAECEARHPSVETAAAQLIESCRRYWDKWRPSGVKLQVTVWDSRCQAGRHTESEKLHDRYVLHGFGGVSIGHGVDSGPGEAMFHYLTRANHARVLTDFRATPPRYRLVRQWP
jgi:hypothetical protein